MPIKLSVNRTNAVPNLIFEGCPRCKGTLIRDYYGEWGCLTCGCYIYPIQNVPDPEFAAKRSIYQ